MKKYREGFTLTELMTVVAIIGILVSVALPAYLDYLARTQVGEAVTLLSSTKTPLSDYVYDRGAAPDAATFNDLVPVREGKYVENIVLSGTISNLLITATMKSTQVSQPIRGRTVTLRTTDMGKTWICAPGTVSNRFLPAACR
jgi:type IV pilus assembly protein PilA